MFVNLRWSTAQGQAGLVAGSLALLPGASSFQFSPEMANTHKALSVMCNLIPHVS